MYCSCFLEKKYARHSILKKTHWEIILEPQFHFLCADWPTCCILPKPDGFKGLPYRRLKTQIKWLNTPTQRRKPPRRLFFLPAGIRGVKMLPWKRWRRFRWDKKRRRKDFSVCLVSEILANSRFYPCLPSKPSHAGPPSWAPYQYLFNFNSLMEFSYKGAVTRCTLCTFLSAPDSAGTSRQLRYVHCRQSTHAHAWCTHGRSP